MLACVKYSQLAETSVIGSSATESNRSLGEVSVFDAVSRTLIFSTWLRWTER